MFRLERIEQERKRVRSFFFFHNSQSFGCVTRIQDEENAEFERRRLQRLAEAEQKTAKKAAKRKKQKQKEREARERKKLAKAAVAAEGKGLNNSFLLQENS
jgi:hypothetical protein